MISAAYVRPDSPPADGPDLASALGWYHFSNFALARADAYPECAHLAAWGWTDQFDALDHELGQLPHDADVDPDLAAIAGQVLAALRARPDGALEFRVSTGEPSGDESAAESIFREDAGPPPFPGAVFDKAKHRWVKPDGSEPTGKEPTGGKPAAELHPDDKAELAAGIDKDVAALPDGQKPPAGLVEKAKDLALTVAAKALVWLHKFNESTLGQLVAEGIDALFDGPTDMKKLGYNPTNSSGTANAGNLDSVKNNLADSIGVGVSGHLVASIASKVLTKVYFWARSKLAGGAKAEAVEPNGDGISLWAELIAQLFAHLNEQFGLDGAPDAQAVAAKLRQLLKGSV